ncbi:MAG: helix-turn-helix domain-containing protein [Candidatus Altiarchaeota archaeon]|nr:helix-turn-helix domain-containing protein [Candidatus Altiarchaeota archaeon]
MELRKFVDKLKNKGDLAEVKDEKSRSFDLAFVEDRAYLIKMVGNADGLSKDSLDAFKKCASVVGAEPMVVSKKFKKQLVKGVVYHRYGVPVMDGETFLKYLEDKHVALADRGCIKVPIENLREIREHHNLSRNLLAEKLDVTPEMVRRYEEGEAAPSKEMASKLEDILGKDIFSEVYFDVKSSDRAFIGRGPFEVAFKKEKTFLVSLKDHKERIKNLEKVSDVLGAEPVVAKGKDLKDLGL